MSAQSLLPKDRVFVALDVEILEDADKILSQVDSIVTGCKIGTQLFTAAGPRAVELAHKRGFRVFLDLKFHDIPNTVAGAVREATRLGVFMLNVHASGGSAMLHAASESATKAAKDFAVSRPICLAVTVLTSLERRELGNELGVSSTVEAHVLHLAELARAAGMDGCVASAREIAPLRNAFGQSLIIVTPGIRPSGPSGDDQARTATAREAIRAGADYLVVGRPVTRASNPASAAKALIEEIS